MSAVTHSLRLELKTKNHFSPDLSFVKIRTLRSLNKTHLISDIFVL